MKKIRTSDLIVYLILFGLLIEINVILQKVNYVSHIIRTKLDPKFLKIGDHIPTFNFINIDNGEKKI